MKPHQVLEIIGLLLLLISVGWELFFSMAVDSIEKQIESILLHDKLDQLRDRQLLLQRHLELKISKRNSEIEFPGYPLSKDWNPSAHDETLPGVARQAEGFRRIKIGLFIVGSVLLILAKIIEYSRPV
jgi:hypothetical protein